MYIIDFSADIINKKVGVFIFLLKGKRKTNQKENLFNVSLSLQWASLRSPSLETDGTPARNVWNLARAFRFQQELNLSC